MDGEDNDTPRHGGTETGFPRFTGRGDAGTRRYFMDGETELTQRIIGCALEVHRHLGPGLLENVYESALCIEMRMQGLQFARQVGIPLYYRGELISEHRPDLIVEKQVVVEIKSVERLTPLYWAQVLTYLRVTGLRVGLLLNFNSPTLRAGTRRIVLNA